MKAFLETNKKILFPAAFIAILAGAILVWFGLSRTFTVLAGGETITINSPALTVSGVLRAAGVQSGEYDRVQPAKGTLIWNQPVIRVDPAREVVVKTPDYELNFQSAEKIPANILQTAEIPLYPNDQVRIDGAVVDANGNTAPGGAFVLQFTPAQPITLSMGEQTWVIYSAEPTLGSALEKAGIELGPQDAVSLDPNTPLTGPLTVTIRRARTVTVAIGETTVSGLTAAITVGSALQDLNVPLQNLDYSIPAEDADLPADGQIKVVRVWEEILVMTDEVPYSNDYVEDPNTPLDQSSVVVPGQVGIYASRERVQYADGVEVRRDTEPTWQASEAKNGVLGYGTDIVVQTTVVDGVTIEYWRKKTVYATSYKPCNDYTGVCMDGTAGGYPLQKGIIAVMPWWYSVPNGLGMADLHVYVAGYGEAIVGDTCGGCSGDTPWIDLAYREENYVPWHHWTTMYFLTPVPDRYIPAVITP